MSLFLGILPQAPRTEKFLFLYVFLELLPLLWNIRVSLELYVKCFLKILICLLYQVEFCEDRHCPFHHIMAKAWLGAEHIVGTQ